MSEDMLMNSFNWKCFGINFLKKKVLKPRSTTQLKQNKQLNTSQDLKKKSFHDLFLRPLHCFILNSLFLLRRHLGSLRLQFVLWVQVYQNRTSGAVYSDFEPKTSPSFSLFLWRAKLQKWLQMKSEIHKWYWHQYSSFRCFLHKANQIKLPKSVFHVWTLKFLFQDIHWQGPKC